MVFCFVPIFFIGQHKSQNIYFFCRAKGEFFFKNLTLGYITKTVIRLFFFPPPKSEYFFQQHQESEYFFRKKTITSVLNNKNNLIEFKNFFNFFFTCRRCLFQFAQTRPMTFGYGQVGRQTNSFFLFFFGAPDSSMLGSNVCPALSETH